LHMFSVHTKFDLPNFVYSKNMTGPQNFKIGHATHLWWFVTPKVILVTAYMYVKFEDCSFSHSKKYEGRPKT